MSCTSTSNKELILASYYYGFHQYQFPSILFSVLYCYPLAPAEDYFLYIILCTNHARVRFVARLLGHGDNIDGYRLLDHADNIDGCSPGHGDHVDGRSFGHDGHVDGRPLGHDGHIGCRLHSLIDCADYFVRPRRLPRPSVQPRLQLQPLQP